MSQATRNRIIQEVDRLDDSSQQQVLDFAQRLTAPGETPGGSVLHFVGSIDPADLETMSQAIEEGCEKVDSDAW